MITLPNIGLRGWNLPTDPYDSQQLVNNWALVDEHDHTPGKGLPIDTGAIADHSITAVKLATDAFTAGLPDGAVTTVKLANNAVTSAKILDGTIQDDDIGNGQIQPFHFTQLPMAKVKHNTGQNVTSGGAGLTLAFNTELFDTNSIHDTVTNNSRLTCQTPGVYLVVINIGFNAANNGIRQLIVRVNGVDVDEAHEPNQSSGYGVAVAHTSCHELAIADYVQVHAFQDSGGTIQCNANDFGMYWIGPPATYTWIP